VTGETRSEDFPRTAGVLQERAEYRFCYDHLCTDAFVTKINASGSAIVYSTYLFGEFGWWEAARSRTWDLSADPDPRR
jgi:hypothetical protein